jgi:hypothetical protein
LDELIEDDEIKNLPAIPEKGWFADMYKDFLEKFE